jgi:hypothetical protein
VDESMGAIRVFAGIFVWARASSIHDNSVRR